MNLRVAKAYIALFGTLVPLYISVQMSLFICDQYVYYKYLQEVGLPYGRETDKEGCINRSTEYNSSGDYAKLNKAQEKTAYVTSTCNSVSMATGIVSTLVIGHLSDRCGRRFVLLWILLSEALHIASLALLMMFELHPWTTLAPNLIEGVLCGGLLSAIAQFSVCVVDLNKRISAGTAEDQKLREQQQQNKCWLLLALFDGFACLSLAAGNALGGEIVYDKGFTIAGLSTIIIFSPAVLSIYFVPETLSVMTEQHCMNQEENESLSCIREQQPTSHGSLLPRLRQLFVDLFKILCSADSATILVMAVLFLYSIAGMVEMHYMFLYLMGPPFCWNSAAVGLYSGVLDAISAVFSALLVAATVFCGVRLLKKPGGEESAPSDVRNNSEDSSHTEEDLQLSSPISNVKPNRHWSSYQGRLVSFLAIGLLFLLANKVVSGIACLFSQPAANVIVFIGMALKLVKSVIVPVIRALLASWIKANQQGRVFAIASLWERIGLLLSLATLPLIYAATLTTFIGSVFMVAAAIIGMALVFTGFIPVIYKRSTKL
ncbi:unnamed protein product [Calicophoron daubneyi]|uniref:Adenylate cyclase n=1 Tax=Calicophoron daubneyi TaxID=300641 RepID=A0AAV2TAS2_CALDB